MSKITCIRILVALLFTLSNPIFAQWEQTNGPYGVMLHSLAVSGTNLFAGTDGGGVFLSTNNGTSWTEVNTGLMNTKVYSLAVSGTNLFAGTYGGGVFLSTNNGTSWTEVNTGLTNPYVSSLAVSGTNLFAGTDGDGVWRRPLSEMITSVPRPSTDLPTHFILNQNYPNPFNPKTKISYSLAIPAKVQLTVCNMFGQQVALLDEGLKPTGNFSVDFNADNLPSGIYYYRLQCGNRQETRQMILIK